MTGSAFMTNYFASLAQAKAMEEADKQQLQYLQQQQSQLLGGSLHGNWSANPQVHSNSPNSTNQGNSGAFLAPGQGPGSIAAAVGAYRVTYSTPPKVEDAGIQAGEILAWRYWKISLDPIGLRSVYIGDYWPPGATMESQLSPEVNNQTGFYAYKDRYFGENFSSYKNCSSYVFGSILLWGQIIEHEYGFRAQFAKIKSLETSIGDLFYFHCNLTSLRKLYNV